MTKREALNKIDALLDKAKFAVLSTVNKKQEPEMRWMSPVLIQGYDDSLFCVTSKDFKKVGELKNNPNCSWLVQTKDLNEIVHIHGRVNIIENPSLKAQVLEEIGPKVIVFWKVKEDESDFVVLETIIDSVTLFRPLKKERITVDFAGGRDGKSTKK